MEQLKIRAAEVPAKPGDFGASVVGHDLVVPEQVARIFVAHGVRDATGMLSYIDAFPSTVAHDLQWSVSDVLEGLKSLRVSLSGHVSEAFLNPQRPRRRAYGALPPRVR